MSKGSVGSDIKPHHVEHNRAQINKIDGDVKSLQTQLRMLRGGMIKPEDMKEIKDNMAQMRSVIEASKAVTARLQEVEKNQAVIRQTLDQVPNVKQLQQIKNMVDKSSASEEAFRHRTQQQMDSITQRIQATVQEDLANMKALVERSLKSLDQVQQKGDLTSRSLQEMKSQVDPIKKECEQVKKQTTEMKRGVDEAVKNAKEAAKEMKSLKDEASGAKGLSKENQSKVRELERKTKGLDKFDKMEVKLDEYQKDYFALKKKLQDAGVFKPPPPDDPEVVAVGTLELSEDIFSARLLLRLGVMKGRSDDLKEKIEGKEKQTAGQPPTNGSYRAMQLAFDSETEEDTLDYDESSVLDWDEHVAGIEAPESMPGTPGWCAVNYGFLGINYATLGVQVTVVLLLAYYGFKTGQCVPAHMDEHARLILHFSRAAATMTAGFIMGKDIMELANYIMTSVLLEPHLGCEVIGFAFFRVTVALTLGAANVIMFMGLTNPFDIWLNLTALGFVAELGGAMLDVSKRGFFGHSIAKATTDVNFELFFLTEYPHWFTAAQKLVQLVGIVFIIGLGTFMFFWPDMEPSEDGSCELEKLGLMAWMTHLGDGGFHEGGAHHAAAAHHGGHHG